MGWIIWGVILPSCLVAAWLIVSRPLRQVIEELRVEQARLLFRQRREWLEAHFLGALGKLDPVERHRWEEARWQDEVHWARDNQTHRLLAFVEIRFDAGPASDDDEPGPIARHATALFEYRKGRWFADGKRLDATLPGEALLRPGRFERVAPSPRRG